MQFNAICTECKEMFLFTDDLLYVRPNSLGRHSPTQPICFRCSTTVGACFAVSISVQMIEDKDKPVLDMDDAIEKYGIERVAHIIEDSLKRQCVQEHLKKTGGCMPLVEPPEDPEDVLTDVGSHGNIR